LDTHTGQLLYKLQQMLDGHYCYPYMSTHQHLCNLNISVSLL